MSHCKQKNNTTTEPFQKILAICYFITLWACLGSKNYQIFCKLQKTLFWGYFAAFPQNENFSKKRNSGPEVFCKKVVLRNLAKFTGKHLCQSLFLNKVAGLRRFPVNFMKFLGALYFIEHLWWQLLKKSSSVTFLSLRHHNFICNFIKILTD